MSTANIFMISSAVGSSIINPPTSTKQSKQPSFRHRLTCHFEYFFRPLDVVFLIAADLPRVIPCVVLVFRHTVAIDAIPFVAVPAEPFRQSQIIIHATLISVGLVKQDAQFVLFPFALTIAQRISLAGRLLYDRSL